MNWRVLRTAMRRSAAPWVGLVLLGVSLGFLQLLHGLWWSGTAAWNAQWTSMALTTRVVLSFGWPLAAGLGALAGLRDSRSRMTELLATTPRPAWRRAALAAGVTALPVAAAFGLLVLWGAIQVARGSATYLPLGWLPISLVAATALAAAAVFGMGVARLLPSVLTPPLLTVAFLLATVLLRQTTDGAVPSGVAPNRLALLSPVTDMPREMLLTLSGAVHLGQTLWLLGLLGTGFALLVAVGRRARLLALAPALAGAALALLVLPAAGRDSFVVDRGAAALVCDGPVCVTEAHRSRLADFAPRGREALRVLQDALGDQAPTRVQEETDLRALSEERRLSADLVLVDFDDPLLADATGPDLTRLLVAQGLAPNCGPRTVWEGGGTVDLPAQSVAASWALGDQRLRPLEQPGADTYSRRTWEKAEAAWQQLAALPTTAQHARIAQARTAALACRDGLTALTGGANS